MPRLALCLAVLLLASAASAQDGAVHDREVAWRTYTEGRAARVRVFRSDDERRPLTVVVDDRAANGGAVTDEAAFVADLAGREFGFDPVEATFVFRYTAGSFVAGAPDRGKALLLRATFRRTASGGLGSPQWAVIGPDALDALTDRALR